jgi:hypothetical protein
MSESYKDRVDLKFLSGTVFVLSIGLGGAVGILTAVWHAVYYVQRDMWSAGLFNLFAAIVALVTVVLVLVPAALLYSRTKRLLELVSFCIGSLGLLILCAEFYSLSLIHLKAASPAG